MHNPESHDGAMLAAVIGGIALATPLRFFWMRDRSPWWMPFAVWIFVIAIGALAARKEEK